MAQLKFENGTVLSELSEICAALAPLQIELSHWPIELTATVGPLLAAETLSDGQKEDLLRALDDRFNEQRAKYGYQSRDLVVLHPQVPKLDEMLKIFDKCHRHADDEVRYVVDGSGIFGFVMPDQSQIQLTVEREEFIRVPAGTEHWFVLDQKRRIKTVRYFATKEGWAAQYSGTSVRSF
jgi:1,2-dihydroxy-3-keto-5-methylthiopentene dioxygenase